MQEKQSVTHLEILQHAICYLISFGGLYGFYIIFTCIFALFPSFTSWNDGIQNTILTTIAYGFTFISLGIYLYNIALKDIIKQYTKIKNVLTGILYGFGLIAGSIIVSLVVSNIAALLGVSIESNENQQSIEASALSMPVLTALMTVIFAPVTEELGYRFGIFGGIHKYNRYAAYIVTSIIFALIHFNLNNNIVNELLNLPTYIFAGFWLCFAYEKSGSIVTSITAHMTNNLVSLIITLKSASL